MSICQRSLCVELYDWLLLVAYPKFSHKWRSADSDRLPLIGISGEIRFRQRVIKNGELHSNFHFCSDLSRKEVFQPHLPVRLPCYDLVPITSLTLDGSIPQGVRPPASGATHFHDLTGGVYKARERIHRGVADPRLLATPPSWSRVADSNPN